jgi:hypothetical protein
LGPALPGLALPVLMLLVVAGLPELVYVTLSTYLQHNTRSEFRATSMSIAEGFFSIQMLWLFPLVGYLINPQRLRHRLRGLRGLVAAGGGPVHRLAAAGRPRSGDRAGGGDRVKVHPMSRARPQDDRREPQGPTRFPHRGAVEAGIALTGTEVKSLRDGGGNIRESYAQLRNGEVFLVGANIAPYRQGNLRTTSRCVTASCCCTAARSTSWA